MSRSPRSIALQILERPSSAYDFVNDDELPDKRDRALVKELVNGVWRWKRLLDHYIAAFCDRPSSKISTRIMNALRIGVYQLVFMGMPSYAAVDSIVRCMRTGGEKGFVNAVLRSISRNMGHIELPSIDARPLEYAGLRYSYPDWIVRRYVGSFGFEDSLSLLKAQNTPPVLTLRVNEMKCDRDTLLELLRGEGYCAEPGSLPFSVKVSKGRSVEQFPGYREGLFVVQDEAAMLPALALKPKPGEVVWDVCAAPGGKSTQLAEMVFPDGLVVASDISSERTCMIAESCSRLGITNVVPCVLDATNEDEILATFSREGLPTVYDKILVDAPCSGLGTIGGNPDIKWQRQESEIKRLADLQKRILETISRFLKPGGSIVYSTCTLTSEENEGVWYEFIERSGFSMEYLSPADWSMAGLRLPQSAQKPGCIYMLPHIHKTDGFFVAKGSKNSPGVSGLYHL